MTALIMIKGYLMLGYDDNADGDDDGGGGAAAEPHASDAKGDDEE